MMAPPPPVELLEAHVSEVRESRHAVQLPLTTLSYAVCGTGEPLIIVPATISRIDDWLPFIHFVGQRYQTFFFELPGHGGSTPFAKPFSSDLVAEAIEQFADAMGLESFTLMGFSFGGVLTMKTLKRLGDRVSRVVLLSPFVGHAGLRHNPIKLHAVKAAVRSTGHRLGRGTWLKIMRDPLAVDSFVWFATTVGKYETTTDLRSRLLAFSDSAFDTLTNQVREILSTKAEDLAGPFSQPCFFGMSVHDPLLDFGTSCRFVVEQFRDPVIHRFDFPYHCPSEPFTLEQLNRDYSQFLDVFAE
jgi:pimeloyl-ACP methyl ester carboxylesterase